MADARETPNDLERETPVEVVAVRRARAALREADRALGEIEDLLQGRPAISREAIVRAAVLICGEGGELLHELRRELPELCDVEIY